MVEGDVVAQIAGGAEPNIMKRGRWFGVAQVDWRDRAQLDRLISGPTAREVGRIGVDLAQPLAIDQSRTFSDNSVLRGQAAKVASGVPN